MLKLINFLRNIVSNIEIQGCHRFDEEDEKLEHLDFGGGSGLGPKTSAVDMTPRPPVGHAPLKKRLPHILLWSLSASVASGTKQNASDRPDDHVSVCRVRAGAKSLSLFMRSASALGFGTARWVPLG
ncbi:hypothetical protein [Flavimaricola marinus]|uniref:Uncharacterized protein n=1 Tax=Flavimaricola marinus TaxID=1819565 RepID=A0A238LES4_9RHOB|nr:hypothetical protein [Flavimaricola marinus]SMY08063.1 hypothetical protein LOM8899_02211 [Flavimaricola marinus]